MSSSGVQRVSDVSPVGNAASASDQPASLTEPRSGRTQRWLALATIGGLLAATAAAFAITERLKLTPSPILGTRVSKTFSPICRCATGSASGALSSSPGRASQ